MRVLIDYIQHCFIWRPLRSTVPEDARIEHRPDSQSCLLLGNFFSSLVIFGENKAEQTLNQNKIYETLYKAISLSQSEGA